MRFATKLLICTLLIGVWGTEYYHDRLDDKDIALISLTEELNRVRSGCYEPMQLPAIAPLIDAHQHAITM